MRSTEVLRRPVSRSLLAALLVGGIVAGSVVACSTTSAPVDPPPQVAPGPLTTRFYVDPDTAAAGQVRQWEAEGRTQDADQMRDIAEQPMPLWATGDVSAVRAQTGEYVAQARAAGGRPMLVAYNIPHRDCGNFSGGGAPDGDYYRGWIAELAAGIAGSGAVVILEPDAVPHELSGCVEGALRDERYVLLSDAIDTLSDAGATVYLDAGNPRFITDVDALAGALQRSGVDRADGFSLNVANFLSTEDNVAFGTQISQRLGGIPFVIDTSRNGANNPPPAGDFCNPPDQALGEPPTTDTGYPLVDALLWVKRPGESDGECRGGPPAGQWWPDYALGLAERNRA